MPGTIIRRGSRYVVVLDHGSEDGKRKRKWASFPTKREARRYQEQAAGHPGFYAGVGDFGSPHTRFRTYLEEWITDYAARRVRPSTLKRYKELSRVHLIPGLGHFHLARLTPQAIEKFYGDLLGHLSPTTAHHVASLLREALATAVKWGKIVQNPAMLADKPKRVRHEPMLWSEEQVRRFLESAREQKHFLLYATLIATGLRLGEALALQWSDIDLARGVMMVRGGKTANARRAVLLPEELVRELKIARGLGPVFPGANPWTIRKCHFYPLVKRLGLHRIRLHDLRHLHGTLLLAHGVDLATVSARLGHTSKAFTLQTYLHATTVAQRRAAQVANRLLTKSSDPKLRNPATDMGNVVPPAGFEPALPA